MAAINPLTGEFEDRALERQFRAEVLPDWRRQATVALYLGALGYLAFLVNDYPRFGWSSSLYLLLGLRLGTLAIALAFHMVVRLNRSFTVYSWALVAAAMGFFTIFCAIIMTFPYRLDISTSLIVAQIVAILLVVPNRAILAVATGAVASIAFVFAAAGLMTDAYALHSVIIELVIFNLGGAVVALRMHRLHRSHFAVVARERQINERLEKQSTKLVKLATRLAKARDDANHANRAKSEFLAHMSHELRTPLNAINGFSEIIKNEMFGPVAERYRDYAADIYRSGKLLTALINDVLDLSKIEAGKLEMEDERIEPAALVETCLRLVRDRAHKASLRLVTEIPPELPSLLADERLVKQMLLNLLTNAIKFTPGGGRVTTIVRLAEDGRLSFTVRDTGIGIAAEDIGRVLEPYGQVATARDRNPDGTGLGLPLVKKMVELHGGTLTLHSTPRVGTTATLTFPASRTVIGRRHAPSETDFAAAV